VAKRGIKKRDYEKLDDATIARVIQLLGQDKPITKKVACEILNITYNTTRLNKIIEEHEEKIEYTKKRRAAMRGKDFSNLELKDMVVSYLSGESITKIADSMYRSIGSVREKIKKLHLPKRSTSSTYHNPDMMPDEMVSVLFDLGELVWSARYNAVAEIKKDHGCDLDIQDHVYSIWVYGKHNEFAYQPAHELGKLEVLKQFKLRDDEFVKTETSNFIYRID